MEQTEQEVILPDNNPTKRCSMCKREYPTWKIVTDIESQKPRLGHNFLSLGGNGADICIDCAVTRNRMFSQLEKKGENVWR